MPRPSIATERQEEILQAFEVCALRKGLAATTLADVAEEAGLPRPLVRHFMGNRAELVAGLIDRMMLRASEAIEQAISASGDQPEDELLRVVLNTAFADPITNRLMIQLWQQSWADDDLHRQLTAVYKNCIEQIGERLSSGATPFPYDAAYALAAMALGNAVFQQFDVRPSSPAALLRAGQAVVELPTNNASGER